MLVRIRKLEVGGQHPILRKIGSIEQFERVMLNPPPNVDPRVGPFFVTCVRSWIDGTDSEHLGKPMPAEFNV
jgi:hypothetical protein